MSTAYMRYLETAIAKYQRRIKSIKDNPDPTKLKSNLMLYEMELEDAIGQLEDHKAGKPFAYGGYPRYLLRSMGFSHGGGHGAADRTAQGEGSTRYLDSLRNGGWPELACDRTVVAILLVTSGDFPKPSFVSICNESCEFASHNGQALAQLFHAPYFVVDVGNEANDENLRYVTDQLGEMVEYIQAKVPGVKYDEDRLLELQHYDREGSKILKEIYEFRKRRPSPVNPRDAQREQGPRAAHGERGLAYMKAQRDELFERVEKGEGVMPEEKVRLLWTTVGINYDESIYKWLEEQGVAIYYITGNHARTLGLTVGFYGDPWHGRKLTPLEEEARCLFYNSWNGRGQRLIDDFTYIAKDQGVDGTVYVMQPGCISVLGARKLVADAMEAAGIPTLSMEIRGIFKEGYSQKDVKAKLADFIEICLARKQAKAVVA
ncbi:MAG: 2-hydroxyglutaryl-CoA dehydratase D-component [Dehalococcoidales bacterium]|nr:2-hydroxyglutaryl-CoA dehydratase D-component [Dehalococcoidales bacterium]